MLPQDLFIDRVAVSLLDEELKERFIKAGEKDETVMSVLKALKESTAPPIRTSLKDWTIQDGIVTYKGQIYVPDDLELR